MRVTKDRFVDAVTILLFSVDDFEAERRLRNAVDLSDKVAALIVEKRFAICNQELQIADLW